MADIESAGQPGMAQCEITGKWVPDDELVTIHGKRVCAEGKAELLDRLRSGERLPGELERPGVGNRFGAMFLDGLLLGGLAMIVALIFGTGTGFFPGAGAPAGAGVGLVILQFILGGIVPAVYYTVLHGRSGQTVGKSAAKIKVVRMDGSDIDYQVAFARFLWYQGPGLLATIVSLVALMAASEGLLALAGVLGFLSSAYILISAVMALMDRSQQRAIHDRLAGTRVIRLE